MIDYTKIQQIPSDLYAYVGDEEFEYIFDKLHFVEENYTNSNLAFGLACETDPTIGLARHILSQLIFLKYKESDNCLEILAVAIALSREGAYYRRSAIKYFEKFFSLEIDDKDAELISTRYSDWYLHSILADLYEKEYEFQKAVNQLEKCIQASGGQNPADYTRIGDILIKCDIQQAKEYYDELLNSECYNLHKYTFDYAYSELCKKINAGYVYKKRSSKNRNTLSDEQILYAKVAEYLI